MVTYLNILYVFLLSLLVFKCLTVGSDFSIITWFKFRKEYENWYFNRETFIDYKNKSGGNNECN